MLDVEDFGARKMSKGTNKITVRFLFAHFVLKE